MTREQKIARLTELQACEEGMEWAVTEGASWETCSNPSWMIWLLETLGTDRSVMRTLIETVIAMVDDRDPKLPVNIHSWLLCHCYLTATNTLQRGGYGSQLCQVFRQHFPTCPLEAGYLTS